VFSNEIFKPRRGSNALHLKQRAYALGHCREGLWPNVIIWRRRANSLASDRLVYAGEQIGLVGGDLLAR
jgi:hypothetical protein